MARSIQLIASGANGAVGDAQTWDGGEGGMHVQGTWDGASVTLRAAPVAPVAGVTMTAVDTDIIATSAEPYVSFNWLPSGTVRAVISGGGGTTSLTVTLARK